VALFRCEHCDLTKPVPDKYLGRKVRCPECGKDSPVIADVPEIALPASLEEEGTGAVFRCSACGHEEAADPASLGEERRCANCGGAGAVRPVRREVRVPTPEDVNLDDLAESLGEGPSAYRLEMEKERKENSARPTLLLEEGEHRPSLLQGGILGNLVSGVASGLLGMLFGAALAVLLLGAAWVDAWFGLAFGAVLLASVAGSLLMAARSGVYFGLAAPDPTGCAVLGMVVGGMAGAMPGAPAEAVAATAVAAGVSLALGMGLLAWLTWASGNGNWTRFLPVQILCGVPAALGFSVLAAAWRFLLGPEAESTSLLLVMARSGRGSRPCCSVPRCSPGSARRTTRCPWCSSCSWRAPCRTGWRRPGSTCPRPWPRAGGACTTPLIPRSWRGIMARTSSGASTGPCSAASRWTWPLGPCCCSACPCTS
jgi:hypothetical protein